MCPSSPLLISSSHSLILRASTALAFLHERHPRLGGFERGFRVRCLIAPCVRSRSKLTLRTSSFPTPTTMSIVASSSFSPYSQRPCAGCNHDLNLNGLYRDTNRNVRCGTAFCAFCRCGLIPRSSLALVSRRSPLPALYSLKIPNGE